MSEFQKLREFWQGKIDENVERSTDCKSSDIINMCDKILSTNANILLWCHKMCETNGQETEILQDLSSSDKMFESCESKTLGNTSDNMDSEYKPYYNAARVTRDKHTMLFAKGENTGQKEFQNENSTMAEIFDKSVGDYNDVDRMTDDYSTLFICKLSNVLSPANCENVRECQGISSVKYFNRIRPGGSVTAFDEHIRIHCIAKKDALRNLIDFDRIEAKSKMADISFAPKRTFPREFRAQSACFNKLRAKPKRTQHGRTRSNRVKHIQAATRWQTVVTKWPMLNSGDKRLTQEKLKQNKFISQDIGCIKLNMMLVSSDTRRLGWVTHRLDVHIALIIASVDYHFSRWMLLQLSQCEYLFIMFGVIPNDTSCLIGQRLEDLFKSQKDIYQCLHSIFFLILYRYLHRYEL